MHLFGFCYLVLFHILKRTLSEVRVGLKTKSSERPVWSVINKWLDNYLNISFKVFCVSITSWSKSPELSLPAHSYRKNLDPKHTTCPIHFLQGVDSGSSIQRSLWAGSQNRSEWVLTCLQNHSEKENTPGCVLNTRTLVRKAWCWSACVIWYLLWKTLTAPLISVSYKILECKAVTEEWKSWTSSLCETERERDLKRL